MGGKAGSRGGCLKNGGDGLELSYELWTFSDFWVDGWKFTKFLMSYLKPQVSFSLNWWCQNWRGIYLSVENWHEEFGKFWPEHSKNSKMCTFNRLLLTKVNNVWAKKSIDELFLIGLNIDAKFEEKNDLRFQKWHEEFSKFLPEHVRKSKNCDFDGVLLSKVENVWA